MSAFLKKTKITPEIYSDEEIRNYAHKEIYAITATLIT